MSQRHLLCLALALLPIAASNALATTYVVHPDGTGDFPTIQAAIDAAADGDVVELTDGTFVGLGNRDMDFGGKAITVRSQSGDPESCTIDCEGTFGLPHAGFRFISGEGSTSTLEGVTVTGGFTPDDWPNFIGGAITCIASSPDLRNCIFSHNQSMDGAGGVHCDQGASPRLFDCRFTDNESLASGGGAIACLEGSEPRLFDCHFSGNRAAEHGGAMVCIDGDSGPELLDCVFTDNTAGADGGAIATLNTSLELRYCTFTDNQSGGHGGAVKVHSNVSMTADFCVFARNQAGDTGGGLAMWGDVIATVSQCTFVANSTSTQGGGLACWGGLYLSCTNTIVAFNQFGGGVGCHETTEVSLWCCDVYGNVGGDWNDCLIFQEGDNGNISEDPLFCDMENGDYSLHEDSPCAGGNIPPECGGPIMGALFVGCDAVGVAAGDWPSPRIGLRVSPNPLRAHGVIEWAHEHAEMSILRLYDPRGRIVLTHGLPPGSRRVRWATVLGQRALAPGVYFLELGGRPGSRESTRIVVSR